MHQASIAFSLIFTRFNVFGIIGLETVRRAKVSKRERLMCNNGGGWT